MKISINTLKKNPLLNYLIQLQDKNKYAGNTPRIIIVKFFLFRIVTPI